jgi:hypothetical protein
MLRHHPDMKLGHAVGRLRCMRWKGPPVAVWLSPVQQREHCMGALPGWSVRLL